MLFCEYCYTKNILFGIYCQTMSGVRTTSCTYWACFCEVICNLATTAQTCNIYFHDNPLAALTYTWLLYVYLSNSFRFYECINVFDILVASMYTCTQSSISLFPLLVSLYTAQNDSRIEEINNFALSQRYAYTKSFILFLVACLKINT